MAMVRVPRRMRSMSAAMTTGIPAALRSARTGRPLSLDLGEAVGEPAHPHHQRCRRTGLALEISREFLAGHADARREFGGFEAGPAEQHSDLPGDFSAFV